jgi:methyl-accepting chemotaxis protein
MDEVTQQNAALVEEAAAAAESLEEQARGLVEAVSRFDLGEGALPVQQHRAVAAPAAPRRPSAQPRASSPIKKISAPQFAAPEDQWEEF